MPETIGQRLKREREARYISLEKAAEETRIRRIFLQALEADDFSVMPSAAQGRGFLRNYAEYLDLDVDALIAEIQRNPIPPAEVSGPLPQVNLSETELPPLTEPADEKLAPFDRLRTTPRFLDRILNRKPKAEPTPEAESQNQPTAENLAGGEDQPEAGEEAEQGLWGRIRSWFKIRIDKKDSAGAIVPQEEENEEKTIQEIKPSLPADAIMAEIGSKLRERRETISLTVAEVERHTHLRAVFVKALEEGAFEKLPSTVQTRGMLSNYANFLGLDVDEVLLRYADALQARRHEKYSETPLEKIQTQVAPAMPFLRTFIAGDLIFGLLMVAALTALAIWGVGRIVDSSQREETQPTAPSIAEVLVNPQESTASVEATTVAVVETLEATPIPGLEGFTTPEVVSSPSDANVVVTVFALERVFVRITADGRVAFEGRMPPRETKTIEAENQIAILTGDGSALRITYNGTDLGLMGGPGEVVSRVYSVAGVATPTATVPPTATNTLLTTSTVSATATRTPTATVAP
jgi:cytoskeletal protein RodZ